MARRAGCNRLFQRPSVEQDRLLQKQDPCDTTIPCPKCGGTRLIFSRSGPACRRCGHPYHITEGTITITKEMVEATTPKAGAFIDAAVEKLLEEAP